MNWASVDIKFPKAIYSYIIHALELTLLAHNLPEAEKYSAKDTLINCNEVQDESF